MATKMVTVVAVPDIVSPSYFPVIAAVNLGICAKHGLDARIEHIYPVTSAVAELSEGRFDFLAGAAHSPFYLADPLSVGVVCALSQGAYWFLVVRSDIGGDLADLGTGPPIRIGAAPGVDVVLAHALSRVGTVGADRVEVVPIPKARASETSFGVGAATALTGGDVDGFWANGMAAELMVRNGVGRVILDARRDSRVHGLTYAALMCSTQTTADQPGLVAAMAASIEEAQRVLAAAPSRAAEAAEGLFPPYEQSLIPELIARDAPYYQSEAGSIEISRDHCRAR